MPKSLQSIAAEALRAVAAGSQSTPLASLSLFIAASSDPSRSVAKSFDVLTLSSPVVGVARVTQDCAPMIRRIPATPRPRGRWAVRDADAQSSNVTIGDLGIVAMAPRKRRRP